ncbi:hypothetical protein C8K15_12270 [Paenisporosarcina sp. OV554]|nr:hypothetical protein C8K15_12270 [Paenisporosarcina sp. OV554]
MSGNAKTPEPPYYAVIFSSQRTEVDRGYGIMADKMVSVEGILRSLKCTGRRIRNYSFVLGFFTIHKRLEGKFSPLNNTK